ncbi:hypothetical protein NMP99_02335 [Glutamicibacter mishrai]|uniref:hypothetical protein n=1 Tax=Glutamicibacter mishrai TaxID=1775880 RepID=UPI001268474B|nr:hypothetical protein [Glutamicibacter mishrai]UTT40174.1 hypothetical protein NMP99_02335 [Glutamicibacter mishrai]
MPRFENANRSDYREVVPGEVPRDEFLLSRLRQQCLPLPDVETSTVSMQSALGYKVQKYLSGSELRNLTLDYLLSHYAVELDRDEFNSAISSVTSAVLTLRDAPATEQTVDDVMLAIHAYFWLENITAEALLEGFEC